VDPNILRLTWKEPGPVASLATLSVADAVYQATVSTPGASGTAEVQDITIVQLVAHEGETYVLNHKAAEVDPVIVLDAAALDGASGVIKPGRTADLLRAVTSNPTNALNTIALRVGPISPSSVPSDAAPFRYYSLTAETDGKGQAATFDVTVDETGAVSVEVVDGGFGYQAGDVVTIPAATLVTPENVASNANLVIVLTADDVVNYANNIALAGGSGSGATANLVVGALPTGDTGVTGITIVNPGTDYAAGDTLTIPGAALGSTASTNLEIVLKARDINVRETIWCYTTDPDTRWELCDPVVPCVASPTCGACNFGLCADSSGGQLAAPADCAEGASADFCPVKAFCTVMSCSTGYAPVADADTKLCSGTSCLPSDHDVCCGAVAPCTTMVCPADSVLKDDAGTRVCQGVECTDVDVAACCDTRDSCATYVQDDCPVNSILRNPPPSCVAATCLPEECCESAGTCNGFDVANCPADNVLISPAPVCAAVTCAPDECCEARGSCSTFACAAGTVTQSPAPQCASAACTQGECCEPVGDCGTFDVGSCGAGEVLRSPAPACAAAACTAPECCVAAGSCSTFDVSGCAAGEVKRDPAPTCAAESCTGPECCEAAGDCANFLQDDCPTGETLIAPPPTCAAAACTAAECCEVSTRRLIGGNATISVSIPMAPVTNSTMFVESSNAVLGGFAALLALVLAW